MIDGFEFDIETADGERRWAKIQGNGGLMGSGSVYAYQTRPARALRDILDRARVKARRGAIMELVSWDVPPADRFRGVAVEAIHDVRAILPR